MERILTVGISDMKASKTPGDVLVTHSLGSCLGLAAYDPEARVGGLIHCLLSTPGPGKVRGTFNPCMFVVTGIPALVQAMYAFGAKRHRLVFKAAGCARMLNVQSRYDTGTSNYEALLKLLAINKSRLTAKDVGGTIPRTMRLHVDKGLLLITSLGNKKEL